jgi:hypothetical protein
LPGPIFRLFRSLFPNFNLIRFLLLQEWLVLSRLLPVTVLSFALTATLSAQTLPDEIPETSRLHLGRIRLNPTVALTNAGVDNNVFNASEVDRPQSDFTMTLTPQTDLWFPLGRTWFKGSIKEDFVYYRTFASERSVNSMYRGDVIVPITRLTFRLGGEYLNTRDRPGFEIDARSRHTGIGSHASAEVRAFGKTFVNVGGWRSRVAFEPDATFLGRSLRTELNRTTSSSTLGVRHQLTPVTSVTATVSREADRFEYATVRDSDSTRAEVGVKFNARIGGSAAFGFRDFQPVSSDVRPYQGPTARVDMSIAPFGATRIGVQVARDIEYSFEQSQPYYVESGGGLWIRQGISGPFDFVARIGAQALSYRGRIGTVNQVGTINEAGTDTLQFSQANRTDTIQWFGGGLGYRVGRDMRIGINVDKQQRNSDIARRSYGGLRFGTSVTYGY